MHPLLSKQLDLLNEPQKESVLHGKDPLLILAGAGSGKTRVITTRIAYLIGAEQIHPASILAVTFTNKAAAEMKERVEKMAPGSSRVMIKTFHSFGAWLLRLNAELMGLKPSFVIYDDKDAVELLRTIYPDQPRNELKVYASLISKAKDECLSPSDNLKEVSNDPRFPEYYAKYEEKLRRVGNADFGDLISLPVRLLKEHDEVRKRIRQRFRAILVDEYQDTNRAQDMLLEQLVGPENRLCVVGDDDQSIYRFRGARVENILSFEKRFPDTKVIRLEENYRSTGHILAAASAVVNNNQGRLGKTLWTQKGDGEKPRVLYFSDQREETAYVTDLLKDKRYEETAILYRTNAQSKSFEDCFRKNNIPYRLVGNLSFYEREEVKDCLAYLSLLLNNADEVAMRRIINKPTRGVGAGAISKIDPFLDDTDDVLEAIKLSLPHQRGKAKKSLEEFTAAYARPLWDDEKDSLAYYIRQFLDRFSLMEHYRGRDRAEGTTREDNIHELINSASEYRGTTEELVRFMEEQGLNPPSHDETEHVQGVTLITMHNTKGLEFERVIITGMEEGLFPRGGGDIYENEEDTEEERRLFYVAVTRAMKELYMTSCRFRPRYGRLEESWPSRFLNELPAEHISESAPYDDFGGSSSSKEQDPWNESQDVSYPEAGKLDIPQGGGKVLGGYSVGTRVYHDDYGNGVVFNVIQNGGHLVINVQFESGKTAVLMPEFCSHKLEKLAHDEWQ
ncbi:MAG: UvrD-helicase domain-containing protein [Spirochaetales bacterium]|nr:UvrD-helicase domain-containing protein [Spirochaetales bacterium]